MHHDGDSGRHDRRFKLKIRHLILAALMLLVVAGVLHMVVLNNEANRRLEALRAAGYPTSLAELEMSNKLPMGVENAAPVYESAFAAFVPPPDPNVPYLGKAAEPSDWAASWPEPVARAVADCLAANENCLALLRQAAGIQTCRYDYDYARGFQHFKEMRPCAQLLKLAAVRDARQGDTDAVVARLKDELRLADSLQKEPFLIGYLVRIAYVALMITGMERGLSLADFTDAQLQELDDALAATAGRIDLAHALITERCLMIEYVRNPMLMNPTGTDGGPAGVIFKLPGIRSQGTIDILDYMGACIEAVDLPPMPRAERFREIGANLDKLSALHISVKVLAPALAHVVDLDSRVHAHVSLARTALAIERYRLAQGKPPEQLADLVPAYLEQVPVDPFDDQPIRYRRTEPGYRLYSIMEDGKDNGGKERDEVGKGEPYDLCFIVVR